MMKPHDSNKRLESIGRWQYSAAVWNRRRGAASWDRRACSRDGGGGHCHFGWLSFVVHEVIIIVGVVRDGVGTSGEEESRGSFSLSLFLLTWSWM
jgi:hypothetical protein